MLEDNEGWITDTDEVIVIFGPGTRCLVYNSDVHATGVVVAWRGTRRRVRLEYDGSLVDVGLSSVGAAPTDCMHCGLEDDAHLDGACLFDTARYQARVLFRVREGQTT